MTNPPPTTTSGDIAALAGAGGIPAATIEWIFAATLTLASETHLGGQGDPLDPDGPIDQVLDRDDATGQPRVRLTSLIGLLRHHLMNTLDGYGAEAAAPAGDDTDTDLTRLFGSTAASSPLTGTDILLQLPHSTPILLRPHNHVDPASGAAKPGAYWYTEHLPTGTHGTLQLRLRTTPTAEPALLALLSRAVDGLTPDTVDAIRLGARTRTGGGQLAAGNWIAQRHDLSTPDGWAAVHLPTWAEHNDALTRACRASPHTHLADAIAATSPPLSQQLPHQHTDQRRADTLTLTVHIGEQQNPLQPDATTVRPGFLRVGDLPRRGDHIDADLTHRTTPIPDASNDTVNWQPVLGVPSLLAVLKTAAIRGATVAATDPAAARRWCRRWWGSNPADSGAPTPARILATEALLEQAQPLTRGRSSTDTLFGDAADQHLFTEALYVGGHATLTVTVRNPDDAIRGQLLLLVCDLASWSPAPIGGGGHGAFTVTTASWTAHTPDEPAAPVDWLSMLSDPEHPARPAAARWMRAYRAALTSPEQR